jgi:hypothetical protein
VTGTSGLADIERFTVTESVIRGTLGVLQKAGREGHEAFVLWAGLQDPEAPTMHVRTAVRPWQKPEQTPDGLLVTVPGRALFSVNKLLYERGEILAGQVHSHPTHAYHSDTDDAFPLVTLLGAVSAVVPNFAREGRDGFRDWVWYRLAGVGRWLAVEPEGLIEVVR